MMGRGERPLPPPFMMGLRAANLTSDQQTQVDRILGASHLQVEPLFRKLHAIHEQIATKLLGAGPVSAADLKPLTQQAGQIHQQIRDQEIDTALKIRAILKPDQLARVAALNEKLRALHEQIEGLMHGGGPGASPFDAPPPDVPPFMP